MTEYPAGEVDRLARQFLYGYLDRTIEYEDLFEHLLDNEDVSIGIDQLDSLAEEVYDRISDLIEPIKNGFSATMLES